MKFKVGDKVLIKKTLDNPSRLIGLEGNIRKIGGYDDKGILVQFIGRTDLHDGGVSKNKDCYWFIATNLKLINKTMKKTQLHKLEDRMLELQQKISTIERDLLHELTELKALKEKKDASEDGIPQRAKVGAKYFYMFSDGEVTGYTENTGINDSFRFYSGNYHLTEELAEEANKRQQAHNRIVKYIYDKKLYFEPDWKNNDEKKYNIYYDYDKSTFNTEGIMFKRIFKLPVLKSEDDARQVITDCMDDLKIFFDI